MFLSFCLTETAIFDILAMYLIVKFDIVSVALVTDRSEAAQIIGVSCSTLKNKLNTGECFINQYIIKEIAHKKSHKGGERTKNNKNNVY